MQMYKCMLLYLSVQFHFLTSNFDLKIVDKDLDVLITIFIVFAYCKLTKLSKQFSGILRWGSKS